MRYVDLVDAQQKEMSKFPIRFAFNSRQLEDIKKEFNCKDEDLYFVGMGGYIRRIDSNKFAKLISELADELNSALQDDDFLLEAIIYELGNHEYIYSRNIDVVLMALGIENVTDRIVKISKKAIDIYIKKEKEFLEQL